MNLPEARVSKPSFTPRFFIYFLLGLVILVLLAEGGYYWWRTRKKALPLKTIKTMIEEVEKTPATESAYLGDMFSRAIINGKPKLFVGGIIVEINNSILTLERDSEQVKVKIDPDVKVRVSYLGKRNPLIFRGMDGLRENLELGDMVYAGDFSFDSQDNIPIALMVIISKR